MYELDEKFAVGFFSPERLLPVTTRNWLTPTRRSPWAFTPACRWAGKDDIRKYIYHFAGGERYFEK
jgi:hypothetical protein